MRLCPVWIPSEINPADGPSRLRALSAKKRNKLVHALNGNVTPVGKRGSGVCLCRSSLRVIHRILCHPLLLDVKAAFQPIDGMSRFCVLLR